MLSWSSPSSPGGACGAPCCPGRKYWETKGKHPLCVPEWRPQGKPGGEGRQGLSPAATGACGSMLGHRDLLCTGYHPAAAGHTAPSPLWGAERLPKRSDLSQRVLVRERSLNPASPSGSSAAAGTHRLSPQGAHPEPFLLAKHEVATPSALQERAAPRPLRHLPFSLHLQDRGCDFPLTPATAVTRNCRAARKLQIWRDKDYFPQKRGENCCICKEFPSPVPSCARLSGVTPSFKHPSFHSLSRNHLH